MKALHLGCGANPERKLKPPGRLDFQGEHVTLDMNKDHAPDVVHNLNKVPLPFDANEFDEIHAYEVLEHCGKQGDARFFFKQFEDFHRILKPGGFLCASTPRPDSPWAWADPSHTRVIAPETLIFLDQDNYNQVGETPMSDFRHMYKADFAHVFTQKTTHSAFWILRAK